MDLKTDIRPELWKAIEMHFNMKDYTETLRDALFFINELIREKSGLVDKDGVKLMESAFLGKGAALSINKGETETEKNMQEGIGFALKGLMMSVRNPISHEPVVFSELDAVSIIMYINYILNIIDKSQSKTMIDDWMDFLLDSNLPNTKRYADELIKQIPNKKKLDLLIQIFKSRYYFKYYNINNIVNSLIDCISPVSRKELIAVVNTDMLRCNSDHNLVMFLHIFTPSIYESLDMLCKLRIENLIKKSIELGTFGRRYLSNGELVNEECNPEGSLATWIKDKMQMFETKNELLNLLCKKLNNSDIEQNYIFKYFKSVVFDASVKPTLLLMSTIHKRLKENDFRYIDALSTIMDTSCNLFELPEIDSWRKELEADYEAARQTNNEKTVSFDLDP